MQSQILYGLRSVAHTIFYGEVISARFPDCLNRGYDVVHKRLQGVVGVEKGYGQGLVVGLLDTLEEEDQLTPYSTIYLYSIYVLYANKRLGLHAVGFEAVEASCDYAVRQLIAPPGPYLQTELQETIRDGLLDDRVCSF